VDQAAMLVEMPTLQGPSAPTQILEQLESKDVLMQPIPMIGTP
jgi:hypothetical protein